jgi:hypothetical protein
LKKDRRRHSSILDVRSFRTADYDTDHYLVVAEVRERLEVIKQTTHRVHIERFNLKKLKKVEGKESLGYHELKKHKSWFDEGCSELLDQRKQAKLR